MVAGFVAVRLLIRGLGDARYGFLSIALMLVGYFGVLDLGIGRALTHGVSRRLARAPDIDDITLEWTGLAILAGLGVFTAALTAFASSHLIGPLISVPPALQAEAVDGLKVVALAVPFVLLSAGLTGILQAHQEFRVISLIQMPIGVSLYVGPVLVMSYTHALPMVLTALLVVRIASAVALFVACMRMVPGFSRPAIARSAARELLSFGGWMTVTNIVSPLMVNMDRLFISSRLSVSDVTYYATPFDVVSKMLMVPSAVANVSFPEFTRFASQGSTRDAAAHFRKALLVVIGLVAPAALVLGLVAHPILAWWVSPALADRSAPIMQILLVGIVINAAAYIPFAFIQGAGRSDTTAKFHVIELVLYVPAIFYLLNRMGLIGVAIAWVLRVAFDALLLFGYAARQLRDRPARDDLKESAAPAAGAP
jgi:O-antigen/teichoic acid export membrane protein